MESIGVVMNVNIDLIYKLVLIALAVLAGIYLITLIW
jgi:hypothetical protein